MKTGAHATKTETACVTQSTRGNTVRYVTVETTGTAAEMYATVTQDTQVKSQK